MAFNVFSILYSIHHVLHLNLLVFRTVQPVNINIKNLASSHKPIVKKVLILTL